MSRLSTEQASIERAIAKTREGHDLLNADDYVAAGLAYADAAHYFSLAGNHESSWTYQILAREAFKMDRDLNR